MNWHSFSKQQYFDSNGLFISTVFSIPILLNCMLLIVSMNNNGTKYITMNVDKDYNIDTKNSLLVIFFHKSIEEFNFFAFFIGRLVVQFNTNDGKIENCPIKGQSTKRTSTTTTITRRSRSYETAVIYQGHKQ